MSAINFTMRLRVVKIKLLSKGSWYPDWWEKVATSRDLTSNIKAATRKEPSSSFLLKFKKLLPRQSLFLSLQSTSEGLRSLYPNLYRSRLS